MSDELFIVRDRDNSSSGWTCVWEFLEGKRTAKPLDYIKIAHLPTVPIYGQRERPSDREEGGK